jgi:hypothetical protein
VNDPAASPQPKPAASARHWPADQTPKIHYSTQRAAEPRDHPPRPRHQRATGDDPGRQAGQHDDFIDPGGLPRLPRRHPDLRYDVMLEAKQKDAALSFRNAIAAAV